MTGQPAEAAPAPPEPPAARGRGTILLVEDSEMVRDLTRSMLESLGYTVLSVLSARAALALCEQADQRIDLLLSDVVMPDMKGPELRERARAARHGLEVVLMSGYAPSVATVAHRAGEATQHFIQKPFTMAELARTLEIALRAARSARARG